MKRLIAIIHILGAVSAVHIAHAQMSTLTALPLPRRLEAAPNVPVTGTLSSLDGTVVTAPLTPALAVIDLDMYERQLATLFPSSQAYYPKDSLRTLIRTRARAWLVRLRTTLDQKNQGLQSVDLAIVASRA